MPSVNEELLSATGMAAAHAALTAKYPWFLHIKPVAKFGKIKERGLTPGSQGYHGEERKIVATALRGRVANIDEMIFLRPIGTSDSTPRRGDIMFTMAIDRSELPATITMDWTFTGTFALAEIIKKDSPTNANASIFCDVVSRRGSVAIYEAIRPTVLRVWTKGQPSDDPSKWSWLLDTDQADIEQFR
jgi:hypothetical protein